MAGEEVAMHISCYFETIWFEARLFRTDCCTPPYGLMSSQASILDWGRRHWWKVWPLPCSDPVLVIGRWRFGGARTTIPIGKSFWGCYAFNDLQLAIPFHSSVVIVYSSEDLQMALAPLPCRRHIALFEWRIWNSPWAPQPSLQRSKNPCHMERPT